MLSSIRPGSIDGGMILATPTPIQDRVPEKAKGNGRAAHQREEIIEELLANPPPYGVLDEAYRIWLRKLIVPSGEG